jgi:hypothetical protein
MKTRKGPGKAPSELKSSSDVESNAQVDKSKVPTQEDDWLAWLCGGEPYVPRDEAWYAERRRAERCGCGLGHDCERDEIGFCLDELIERDRECAFIDRFEREEYFAQRVPQS